MWHVLTFPESALSLKLSAGNKDILGLPIGVGDMGRAKLDKVASLNPDYTF
jgi:hypothetical protein